MELTIIVGALVLMIILGAPIGIAMTAVPAAYIVLMGGIPLETIPYQMFRAISLQPLLAVPFFIFTAEIMNAGRITFRLLDLARELVGRFRGGVAQVNVVGSMMFASMNGSAIADVAAIGGALIPGMKREGYPGPFAAALTAAGSTIGAIIPPSILLVILSSTMGLSIGAVFAGGVVPGIVIGCALMLYVYVYASIKKVETYKAKFTWQGLGGAFVRASGAGLIPVIIVGGILSGIFTATEAGAVASLAAIIIAKYVYRTLTKEALSKAILSTVKIAAPIFLIIAASGPLSWLLNRIGALTGLEAFFLNYAESPIMFAVVVTGFVIVVGMLIEPVSSVVMLAPTIISACSAAGIPEVQAAVYVGVGFITGTITPPVGLSYFTAAVVADESIDDVARAVIPFTVINAAVMAVIMFIPILTLGLPERLGLL